MFVVTQGSGGIRPYGDYVVGHTDDLLPEVAKYTVIGRVLIGIEHRRREGPKRQGMANIDAMPADTPTVVDEYELSVATVLRGSRGRQVRNMATFDAVLSEFSPKWGSYSSQDARAIW